MKMLKNQRSPHQLSGFDLGQVFLQHISSNT
jgi:hypothetical protein